MPSKINLNKTSAYQIKIACGTFCGIVPKNVTRDAQKFHLTSNNVKLFLQRGMNINEDFTFTPKIEPRTLNYFDIYDFF